MKGCLISQAPLFVQGGAEKMLQTRRSFLSGAGAGLLTFSLGGCKVEMTPGEARRQQASYSILNAEEVRVLDALAETLLPGAAAAGMAHFIDHQLAAAPGRQLLMIKYLGVDPPFSAFYQAGLTALNVYSKTRYGQPFPAIDPAQAHELVTTISQENPAGWEGAPAPFFYFVLRNDAVDVLYGTRAGIEGLGIPYMAHIEPATPW